jgi:4-hydroxythreonine-4-phosphate dehydrogenase
MGNTKPIIVVAGEPYSIFLEIFFKAKKITKIRKNVILIVSKKLLEGQMKKLRYNYKINTLTLKDLNINKLSNNEINIIDVDFNFKKVFDKIGEKSNNYIDQCFKIALNLLKEHQCSGLINGPISKKSFLKEKFLGITEYLAKKTNRKNNVAMLIYNRKLSVSPLTTHIPLKNVYKNISKKKLINHVMLIDKFYKLKIKTKPKIGITGLNPHCESNYKSSEEEKIIKPAIKHLLKRGFKIDGPIPADTIFMQENSKKYDVIVGMYHDQVLTPIKTLFGFNAINITVGLPFIRLSPDHGPNSQMLGKNTSNPKSLIEALKFLDK